jgi:DNA-binding GntR family transcriptional regulator
MGMTGDPPGGLAPLGTVEAPARPSVADTVFDHLHRQILSLSLPPGTRMSEADVAQALGTSRQPVRDAFYRLSKLGFLTIRPQRATTVSWISSSAVMQARFVRTAIEQETVRAACDRLTSGDLRALEEILDLQRATVEPKDAEAFHALDDRFHREICERSGHGYVWDVIREMKAHMDRVRFLTLSFASHDVLDEHIRIVDAIRARDSDRAAAEVRRHLSRITNQIVRIRSENSQYFADEPADE